MPRGCPVWEWCLVLTQKPGLVNLPCYHPKPSVFSAFQHHNPAIYAFLETLRFPEWISHEWGGTWKNSHFVTKTSWRKLVLSWTLPFADSSSEGFHVCQVSVTEKTLGPRWNPMSRIQGQGLDLLAFTFSRAPTTRQARHTKCPGPLVLQGHKVPELRNAMTLQRLGPPAGGCHAAKDISSYIMAWDLRCTSGLCKAQGIFASKFIPYEKQNYQKVLIAAFEPLSSGM